jgi:hypothetical protein
MILFFEVNGRGKDILGTLLPNAIMDLDVLFALSSNGSLSVYFLTEGKSER